jgi:hypothetical protein
MNCTLVRLPNTIWGTPGILLMNNDWPLCLTLEPEQPIISLGLWEVQKTFSPKFQKELFEIQNVPGHEGIRFHSGNYVSDTQGCILVGLSFTPNNISNMILDSQIALKKLHDIMPSFWRLNII